MMPCVNSVRLRRLAAVMLQTRSSLADGLGEKLGTILPFDLPHWWKEISTTTEALNVFQHSNITEQDNT